MVQLENGFTRIANELLEAVIVFPFSKREIKIVFAVIRKTYGFNKKADNISLTQLMKLTGIDKANVSRTVADLATSKVLKVNKENHIQLIELNKDYLKWVAKTATVAKTTTKGCQNSNSTVAKTATTKDTITKDKQKTEPAEKKSASCISEKWVPNKNNFAWLSDAGLNEFEQQKTVRDFRDFWILSESKKLNWDLAFRKNPVVVRAVNTKLKQQSQQSTYGKYAL